MNQQDIFILFRQSINWNAIAYGTYKLTNTFLTLLLYLTLNTADFTAWATTQSIIYLILLWIDFGFKKSIPRFSPEFAQNKKAHRIFIACILIIQCAATVCALPLIFYMLRYFFLFLPATSTIYIPLMFISEGIINSIRLLFHAQFFQKESNIVISCFLIIEMVFNLIILSYLPKNTVLIEHLFINKIIMNVCAIITLCCFMPKIINDKKYQTSQQIINVRATFKKFLKHSVIMWANIYMKSITERNFMLPFLLIYAGAEKANLYKIANDIALFFQRIILKSIGNSDTALLAHSLAISSEKKLMDVAFKKLKTTMTALCLPFLVGYIVCIHVGLINGHSANNGFQLIIILGISYIIEVMLLPYERRLEVEFQYHFLAYAYASYAIGSSIMFILFMWSFIGLTLFIASIAFVRLVSLLIMAFCAQYIPQYREKKVFPLAKVVPYKSFETV